MVYEDWNIEEMTGYKPVTTFYMDFSIADRFGLDAIKDTFERAFDSWKSDYKFLTELVMVMNWKLWRWYGHDEDKAKLYEDLYWRAAEYAQGHLKGEELSYYYRITD